MIILHLTSEAQLANQKSISFEHVRFLIDLVEMQTPDDQQSFNNVPMRANEKPLL